MKIRLPGIWFFCLSLISTLSTAYSVVLNVTPGVNNIPIVQVVYTINGSDVTQTTEATGVNSVGDNEVSLKSIRINNNGTLTDLGHFNTHGAEVRNVNPELVNITGDGLGPGLRGLGVYDNGVVTPTTAGVAAFASALAATTTDTDFRHFTYYDFLSSKPTLGVPDYDLLYLRAMQPNDFLLVSERFGNTYFEVTPLKADGTPYDGANVLRFGGTITTTEYTVYDWNTGYAASGSNPGQAQTISVASVSKFFEGTSIPAGPVYGFRIDNDGEADTKIFVVGSNTFEDNPYNPKLVPEPSAFVMAAGGLFCLVIRRRRRS